MSKKLLNKTLKYYLAFSTLILLIAAVVFYFFGTVLYVHNAERELRILKDEFIILSLPELKKNEIVTWNKYNRDLKIRKNVNSIDKEYFFYHDYYNCLSEKYERYRVLHAPILIEGDKYVFSAKVNLIENESVLVGIIRLFAVILIFLLAGLFLITRFLSLRLWKPFYTTLHQIERFEIDKRTQPSLPNVDVEEFERLNNAISKLIKKNTSIYASHTEFIENASHELQTPLAIFKALLQTLLQRPDVTEGQFGLLEDINIAASRLSKINRNLLLLSKLEGRQFEDVECVSVNALIERQLPFFAEQATMREIVIRYAPEQELCVSANPSLLEIVINNLFSNAVRHSADNGNILVAVTGQSIVFSNSATSGALDELTLFKRFTKAIPSSPGSGLGLSIIDKIGALNHWKITYSYTDGQHFFSVTF